MPSINQRSTSAAWRLTSFDQIYDEHFYFFSASTVDDAARRWGLELVGVERLPVHGGEVRYTLARRDRRTRTPAVDALIREEHELGLGDFATFGEFAARVQDRRDRLVAQLDRLRDQGVRVAGYAATAKSATLLNYCQIGADLLPVVYDTTLEKQGTAHSRVAHPRRGVP